MSKSITGLFAGFGRKPDQPAATTVVPTVAAASAEAVATAAAAEATAPTPAPAEPPAQTPAAATPSADTVREAVLAERGRIAAILQHGGPDKVEAAASLALNTDLSAEQACAVLDSLPAAAAASKGTLAALMATRSPTVGVAPGGNGAETDDAWAKRLAGYARQSAAAA